MFERYTEKARRTIFFARYEASSYGSPYIQSEHILLGLLRETRQLSKLMPLGSAESIRKQIDDASPKRPSSSTSVDLPLSNECKRALKYAADEAERLGHRHIGSEHLLLGLLCERGCFAAQMLRERGLELEQLRGQLAKSSVGIPDTWARRHVLDSVLVIHGASRNIEFLHERVRTLRKCNWYWGKSSYQPRDVVVHRKSGEISFDLSLATDTENFELLQRGWKKDLCLICDWELFEPESNPEHGIGYSNGQKWVCTECYEKFLQGPDYFETAHPEIT